MVLLCVLFFNPWSCDMSDSVSSLLHEIMSFMIRAHLFSCLQLNLLADTARAHTCWSHLYFQARRKLLSYPNTFLFVWLTCKECALVSVFERQNMDWTLKLSLHLKWALNTDLTQCAVAVRGSTDIIFTVWQRRKCCNSGF